MKTVGIIASSSLSGGNNVIFEHILGIHKRNNLTPILIFPKELKDEELAWFPGIEKVSRITIEEAKSKFFDVLVCTFWRSCYQAYLIDADSYLYFNQSVESRFYPIEDFNTRNLAEATYLLGFNIITEANWIKNYVKENYGLEAELVLNGIRKENYCPNGKKIEKNNPNSLRVLVEGNITSSFKNIPKTIEICKTSKADEIWLLTNSDIEHYKGVDRIFSNIPVNQTQEIYRSCDILVKLSTIEGMFGPPLEMFHCGGTAITYNVTGHDEYMKHGYNGYVVDMHQENEVIKCINYLKDNPETLQQLKNNAIKTAKNWHDWDFASKEFEKAILKCLEKKQTNKTILSQKTKILTEWFNKTQETIDINNNIQKKIGLRVHNFLKSLLQK